MTKNFQGECGETNFYPNFCGYSERSEAAEGSRARQVEGRAYDRARELGRRE